MPEIKVPVKVNAFLFLERFSFKPENLNLPDFVASLASKTNFVFALLPELKEIIPSTIIWFLVVATSEVLKLFTLL